ncbi:MAG: HupE/UreJ family protein, partial [Planctomycetota bacterium]
MRFLLAALSFLLLSTSAAAHEVRPAYLELRETEDGSWQVLFKVPARGPDKRLSLRPLFPEGCERVGLMDRTFTGLAFVDRFSIRRDGGLIGTAISIEGLSTTLTDVLVRVHARGAGVQVLRLTPGAPSFVVAAAPGWGQVSLTYLNLGIEHILLGIDHLLFVLALLLLIGPGRWGQLLGTITAFTIAHSVTLVAATLGWFRVSSQPVEAIIALSIVFVAAEIMRPKDSPSLARRRPWIVAFLFGLLHGFGFAGALAEIGLPETAVPLSLLFFNLGVEAGQLLFVVAVLALFAVAKRVASLPTAQMRLASVYCI